MGNRHYRAIVLGLGAMGSAAAARLAQKGQSVLGLDRYQPPHSMGSSHGKTRAIRKAYFEDPAYVPLLHRAYESWRRLERDSGRALMEQTGTLMLGPEDSPVVEGSLRSAREHGLVHEVLDHKELSRRFSPLVPGPDTIGVLEEVGGVLEAEASIEAQLELAGRAGAELRFNEPVESWRELAGGDGVEVVTGRGSYRGDRLVLAAGAWSPELVSASHRTLTVTRQVLFWLRPSADEGRFDSSSFPVWVWAPRQGDIFYGFPSTSSAKGVKLGIHSPGEVVAARSVDREVTTADLERLRRCYLGRLRGLDGDPIRSCVCLYTNSPDGHFLLGVHPLFPSVLVAGGFSGHGFKFAALVGEILTDLVIEGSTEHPIDIFSPNRFEFSRHSPIW